MKGENYEAPHFVTFFTHLSLRSVISKYLLQIYITVQIDLDKPFKR